MPEKDQWYSNKQLFEMFQSLKDNVKDLSSELKRTRDLISKYNGLRETIEDCQNRIEVFETQAKTRTNVGKSIREWSGWIFATLMFLINLYLLLR